MIDSILDYGSAKGLGETRRKDIRMTAVAIRLRDPRTLVSLEVWARLVKLIMRDHDLDFDLAERTLGQTLAYLVTSAENPGTTMGPTPAVDLGIHTFVLDTPRYIQFCQTYAGTYIHHVPVLDEELDSQSAQVLRDTIEAIRNSGFQPDLELWQVTALDSSRCTQCHAGCHDSPKP
ncbi:glycine-rich domain-containing protein [Lentzea sp. JNUCC 0626]|uniref:glycine-rich domain-containing protein n=1 Tax=Lentzea sp. JNUCC 0626 TaxID=3367513 RepID=UPI003749CDBA